VSAWKRLKSVFGFVNPTEEAELDLAETAGALLREDPLGWHATLYESPDWGTSLRVLHTTGLLVRFQSTSGGLTLISVDDMGFCSEEADSIVVRAYLLGRAERIRLLRADQLDTILGVLTGGES
jgi:hypothetical protein